MIGIIKIELDQDYKKLKLANKQIHINLAAYSQSVT